MGNKRSPRSARRQRHVRNRVESVVRPLESMSIFDLMSSPELLGDVEALLPKFRERNTPDGDSVDVPGESFECPRVLPERGQCGGGPLAPERLGAW